MLQLNYNSQMMSLKFVLIKFLALLHFAIVAFVISGFLVSNTKLLIFHLVLIPALIIHWRTNQGVCYLTQIENRIKGVSLKKTEMKGGFTEAMFKQVFGHPPTPQLLQNLIYGIMALSWSISLARLFHQL